MNPLAIVFWLMEHWYYVAIVGVVILAAALWGGVVSLAAIIEAVLAIAARIAKFFATPADQIAEKALFGFIVAVLSASLFYQLGGHDERGVWVKREADHAAAMERLKNETAAVAEQKVNAATAAEREKTTAAEQRIADYEKRLAVAPNAACELTDADRAAAGIVRPRADRPNLRRRPR